MKRIIYLFAAILLPITISTPFLKGQVVGDSSERLIELSSLVSDPGNIDSNVKYELIMNAFMFENNILKPNAAILISNKETIKQDAELFLAEKKVVHACGYHYTAMFWSDAGSLLKERAVNEECEIFSYKPKETKERWQHYIKILETNPTHYIYSLEIPVSISPKEVKAQLDGNDFKIFFIKGELEHYPTVYFSHRTNTPVESGSSDEVWENAEKVNETKSRAEFKNLVDKVKSVATVVHESDIHYISIGSVGDATTHGGSITLKLEQRSNLGKVRSVLIKAGLDAKQVRISNPKTYLVQIVDTSPDIKNIKQKLHKYTFIESIVEYDVESANISDIILQL